MRLEPYQLAREERFLSLDLPLSEFPRLAALVERDVEGPKVAVRVQFGRDEQGRCRAHGELSVPVRIRCANCERVEPFELAVEVDLCVVPSEMQASELLHDLDPLILAGPAASPAELFEDDLLLGLPERPCGWRLDCPNRPDLAAYDAGPAPEGERENPFSVLAALKKEDGPRR